MGAGNKIRARKLVFDTNTLGLLVQNKSLEEIDELSKKIIASQSIYDYDIILDITVCNELIRHLKDRPDHKDYIRCRKSLYLIGKLVRRDSKIFLPFNVSWHNRMSFFLTKRYSKSLLIYDNSVVEFIKELSRSGLSERDIKKGLPNYLISENDWIRNRNALIISSLDAIKVDAEINNTDELIVDEESRNIILEKLNDPILSMVFTESLRRQVHKYYVRNCIRGWKRKIKQMTFLLFPASFFFREFMIELVNGLSTKGNKVGSKMDAKRWNSFSDIFIIISCLLSDCILVSSDKDIVAAYNQTGFEGKILKTEDYIKLIETL